MGKYLFIKDELKPHNKDFGDCDGLLVDFIKTLPLINPVIKLNGKNLEDGIVKDDYLLKENDELVIVNQLGVSGLVALVVALVVSYALTTLLAPDKPTIPKRAEPQRAETEFTVNTSQNQARNGEPVPEAFGTYVNTPDIISAPYRRYDGNDQFLYMILCLGIGQHTVNDVLIEDTSVSPTFANEVKHKLFKTEASHTGDDKIQDAWNVDFADTNMRDVVITAKEIQDRKLTVANPFDEIQINPSDTITDQLEFDVSFPSGLYSQNSDGTLANRTVNFDLIYTDSLSGTTTQSESITANSRNPIRQTFTYSVTPDYYTGKAVRTTADTADTKIQDELFLETMKAYLVNADVSGSEYIRYGDVSLLAVRIKATEGISDAGQFKIKVKAQRDGLQQLDDIMNYIWSGDNGGRQALSGIDLPVMAEPYNEVIKQRTTVYKALQSVGTSRRYNVFPSFNIITARKDVPQTIRTMLFSEVNIVRNSLKINMTTKDTTDDDGIRVKYKNADNFEEKFVTYPASSSFPTDIKLDGVTDDTFATDQAEFLYKQDRFRAIKYRFDTELDGFIPSLFDRVGVSHPSIAVSQSGLLRSFTTDKVSLREVVKEDYINPKIMFRGQDGKASIIYDVLDISSRNITIDVSSDPLPIDLYVGEDKQKTMYQLGEGVEFIDDIMVTEVRPKRDNVVSIVGWNYNDLIYN